MDPHMCGMAFFVGFFMVVALPHIGDSHVILCEPVIHHDAPAYENNDAAPEYIGVNQRSFSLPLRADPSFSRRDMTLSRFDARQSFVSDFEGLGNLEGKSFPPRSSGSRGTMYYGQIDKASVNWFDPMDGSVAFSVPNEYMQTMFTNQSDCHLSDVVSPRISFNRISSTWTIFFVSSSLRSFCIANSIAEDLAVEKWNGVGIDVTSSLGPNVVLDGERVGVGIFESADTLAVGFDLYDASSYTYRYLQSAVMGVQLSTLNATTPILGENLFDFHMAALNEWSPVTAQTSGPLSRPTFLRIDYFGDNQQIDVLEVWELDVNWQNPSGAAFFIRQRFGEEVGWPVLPYWPKEALLPTKADRFISVAFGAPILGDRPVYRVPRYCPVKQREAIVGGYHVRVGEEGVSGVAWFELSRGVGASSWELRQVGTVGGDSLYRFNPSVSLDADLNIALGYSATSPSSAPDMRLSMHGTGYHELSQMGREVVAFDGSGYDPSSSEWFVFSSMSTDPADNHTFFYMNEYYAQSRSRAWRSRISTHQWQIPKDDHNPLEAGLVGAMVVGAAVLGLGYCVLCAVGVMVVGIVAFGLAGIRRRREGTTGAPEELWSSDSDSDSVVFAL